MAIAHIFHSKNGVEEVEGGRTDRKRGRGHKVGLSEAFESTENTFAVVSVSMLLKLG